MYAPRGWGVNEGRGQSAFGFTGEQVDGNGLVYLRARTYAPGMGRFLNTDPSRQEMNLYQYGFGNPVNYTDPSGYDPLDSEWLSVFRRQHNRDPEAEDYMLRLFSIAFPNEWRWSDFYHRSGRLDLNNYERILGRTDRRSWADVDDALMRLAAWYTDDEIDFFVRDVGSLFGGLYNRFEADWRTAVTSRGVRQWVHVGSDGLDQAYIGSDEDSNIHHWAWAFTLGFGEDSQSIGMWASLINTGREILQYCGDPTADLPDNLSDIRDAITLCSECEVFTEYGLLDERNPLWASDEGVDARADIWLGNRAAMMGFRLSKRGEVSPNIIRQLWNNWMR